MKKFLLLSGLILGSFGAKAQLTCATAKDITGPGIYKVISVAGTNTTACSQDVVDSNGAPLKAYWFKYTPATAGRVTVSSNLPVNVAPKSTDTVLQILTGTCSELNCFDFNNNISEENKLSIVSFIAEEGVTYYIVWNSYFNAAGFDFEVTVNPCIEPETFYLPEDVTTTSAILNWDAPLGNPAQYEVVYVNATDTATEYTTTVDTNSATLSGLVPHGNYYFWVRSLCGVGSESEFAGPFLLSLLKEAPYTTGWDSLNEMAGWEVVEKFPNYIFVVGGAPDLAQTPDNWYISYNNLTEATNNWLYSPAILLTKDQVINASFYLASASTNDRSLKLTIGTAPIEGSQTTTLYSNTAIKTSGYNKITTSNFTAPETGVYYIGINDFSPVGTTTEEEYIGLDTFALNNAQMAVEDFFSKQFNVYPNPANDLITITNSADLQVNSISINDFNGRIVKEGDFNNLSNIKFNVSDLASGVYFMNIKTNKGTATKKIIKN